MRWLLPVVLLSASRGALDAEYCSKTHAKGSESTCLEVSDYIVILDAGSTGTRAHLFHYPSRVMTPATFPIIVTKPLTLPVSLGHQDTKPGISSFVDRPEGLASSLEPILQGVARMLKERDPTVVLKHVPVYLGATAGMRSLRAVEQARVMDGVRTVLRGPGCPFGYLRREQARILSGEEEGAFGWLALNMLHGTISPKPRETFGVLDMGGDSAQITFIPEDPSILADFFPMHFGGPVHGPIHLYTHSFQGFGGTSAFQRASETLFRGSGGGAALDHPCMPSGLTWRVDEGEWGMSTSSPRAQRAAGTIAMRGTGDFPRCRALAESLFPGVPCFQEPCSMLGVYQPSLGRSRFSLIGSFYLDWLGMAGYDRQAPLQALHDFLQRFCSLSLERQLQLVQGPGASLQCWYRTWALTFITHGLGFPYNTSQVIVEPVPVEWANGQAIYEVNFFPYRVHHHHPHKEALLSTAHAIGMTSQLQGDASTLACSALAGALAGFTCCAVLLWSFGLVSLRPLQLQIHTAARPLLGCGW